MYFKIADLCDNNQNKNIQVLSSKFNSYGGKIGFQGRVITIKLDKSNWGLIDILKNEDGRGKVIVVDVDEAFFGVVGDKLSTFAKENNYEGMIINGFVRDIEETIKIDIGLYALGTCPLRNFEKTNSQRDIKLEFGGVIFNNDDYIYGDKDGVIISNTELDTKDVPKSI
jgi:regulator of ribonuclease activity A